MHITAATLLLALLPSTLAYTCLSSNARPWPAGGISPASSTSTCSKACGNDSACLQACLETAQLGECNSVGGSACSGGDSDSSDGLIKRATLTCASTEVCYKYTDDSLLCVDLATANYHDDEGGRGNAGTGVYTSANGRVTTNLGDATGAATATGGATTSVRGGSSATVTGTSATIATSVRGSGASAAAATATPPTGGAEVLRAGGVLGAVGLVVGMVL